MAPLLLPDQTPNTLFTTTKFMKVEETNSNDFQINKLTNEIHPLFLEPLRKAVPKYSVVEQSARLASHFVQCGALHHFFRAFSKDGKHERKWESLRNGGKVGLEIAQERIDETVPVTDADRCNVRNSLQLLSENLEYMLDDKLQCPGMTVSIVDKAFVDPRFPDGERSRIKISTDTYNQLKRAQQSKDTILLLKLQFEFAVLLKHEMIHALDNLFHGNLEEHHFFGDGIVCEAGFEAESRLFGGILQTHFNGEKGTNLVKLYRHDNRFSRLYGVWVLWEYPSQLLVEEYRHGDMMGTRSEPYFHRPLDVAWRVPIEYFRRMFDDSFWKIEEPVNQRFLHPQCSVGYCFKHHPRDGHVPIQRSDEDAKYVPKGYRRLNNGEITLDARGRRSQAVSTAYVNTTKFWTDRYDAMASDNSRSWRSYPSKRPIEAVEVPSKAIRKKAKLEASPSESTSSRPSGVRKKKRTLIMKFDGRRNVRHFDSV